RADIIICALQLRNLAYPRALRHLTQIGNNTITTVISGQFAPLQCCRIYRFNSPGRFGDHLGVGGPLSTVRLVGGAVTPRGSSSAAGVPATGGRFCQCDQTGDFDLIAQSAAVMRHARPPVGMRRAPSRVTPPRRSPAIAIAQARPLPPNAPPFPAAASAPNAAELGGLGFY